MSTEKQSGTAKYHFSLYIDSDKPRCFYAAELLQRLCHQYLPDSYTIDMFDLHEDQTLFDRLKIIAVPTLDVATPQDKTHRFVGDLSQFQIFITALGMGLEADKMRQDAGKMEQDAGKMGELAANMREKI